MAQTASGLASALREQWTSTELEKQWFADDSPLSRFETLPATMIGKQAQVPIWGDLNSGGYTSTSPAGGVLNPPTAQSVTSAVYTLVQHFYSIGLEFSALNQAQNSLQSVVAAKDLEIEGALAALRAQCTRQLVTNGDSIVAQCGTSGAASTTLPLVASPSGTAYGYDALVRRWLRPGAVVDIGTTADTDALAAGATVTAVSESASAPTITLDTAVNATAGTHFVYIANPNSTTAPNAELNGLRNLVSNTGAVGGLNPATAGQEFWAATTRDTSTTTLSLDLMLNISRGVKQVRSQGGPVEVWTSLKQQSNWYALLQNQVRFSGDRQIDAGGVEYATWNGMKVTGWNSVLDSDLWFLNLKSFVRVTGAIKKPTWMSELQGANKGQIWSQGTTGFVDTIAYAFQIGVRDRAANSGATGLTA